MLTVLPLHASRLYQLQSPADRKQDAFNWLREHGLDDIIKNDIVVSFGRVRQDNMAGEVMHDLEKRGFSSRKQNSYPFNDAKGIRA